MLQEGLDAIGNKDVYFLSEDKLYEFTFLGPSSSPEGDFYWLTTNLKLSVEAGESPSDFRAPSYEPVLKLVKPNK